MSIVERLKAQTRQLLPRTKAGRRAWVMAAVVILILVLLPVVLKLDGKPHAELERFAGRFHPLAVHLPIGLLVLLPILELAGLVRPALREAAGFVLGVAFGGCLLSLTSGLLLAHGEGRSGALVMQHMWSAIALSCAVLLCALIRPLWSSGVETRIYPALLTATLLLLAWSAHQGGSITHGANYLTENLPAIFKRLSFWGAPSSNSFYALHINPIFDSKCVSCHGQSQAKGGLRLDSYEHLMKGGEAGAVIVAGNPGNSILFERVTMAPDHKGFMPAEGRPALRAEEINWLRAWIQQGASPSATSLAGIAIGEVHKEPPPPPVGDYSALMGEIQQMNQGLGAKLKPVSSKPEDGLMLLTTDISPQFGDAQLAALVKFAPYIVEADLSRSAVTNACFESLAKFTHLRALHLEGTKINGDGIAKLASLQELHYLNLSGTQLTYAATEQLKVFKNLQHLYMYNTPAQPATSAASSPQAEKSQP